MSEGTSPEEKLLKFIRKKNPAAVKGEAALNQPGVGGVSAAGRLGDSLGIFKAVDKVLIAAIIVLLGYLLYNFKFGKQETVTISLEETTSSSETVAPVIPTAVEPQPFSYYAEKMGGRNIFDSAPGQTVTPDQLPLEVMAPQPLPDITTKLKIVGIVLDKNAEVILEDLEEQKTYFLRKGDRIRDAVVQEIEEGKVILIYNNQTIELVR